MNYGNNTPKQFNYCANFKQKGSLCLMLMHYKQTNQQIVLVIRQFK